MQLPKLNGLKVNLLSACFNNTTATYKYYWLLAILKFVENGKMKISKRDLFAMMISNAWFTVNYFHVSFGKQDLIQQAISFINQIEKIPIDEKQQIVFQKLTLTSNKEITKQLLHFNKNVPHWFLSPWFQKMNKSKIYIASQKFDNDCLYALYEDEIRINSNWKNYLTDNTKVLKDFCYWNLALFLQSKNPNVPDIPNKLIKPAIRSSLIKQRTQYWDIIMRELGSVDCIYTGKRLTLGNYAVEHFIPYNFVSHNLIWNLIPADKAFNCSKNDKLPKLEKYFDLFFSLQKMGVEIIKVKSPKNSFLQDYLSIFPDIGNTFTKNNFKDRFQPLITIASNNGFEFLK